MISEYTVSISISGSAPEVAREARDIAEKLDPRPAIEPASPSQLVRLARMFQEWGEPKDKIPCIKAVRSAYGCSLKEAKEVVEGVFV